MYQKIFLASQHFSNQFFVCFPIVAMSAYRPTSNDMFLPLDDLFYPTHHAAPVAAVPSHHPPQQMEQQEPQPELTCASQLVQPQFLANQARHTSTRIHLVTPTHCFHRACQTNVGLQNSSNMPNRESGFTLQNFISSTKAKETNEGCTFQNVILEHHAQVLTQMTKIHHQNPRVKMSTRK